MASFFLLVGCQKQQDATAEGGKAGANTNQPGGLPPVPSNLPPEVKARIAQEQAQFQSRSEQQEQHAKTSGAGVSVPKK